MEKEWNLVSSKEPKSIQIFPAIRSWDRSSLGIQTHTKIIDPKIQFSQLQQGWLRRFFKDAFRVTYAKSKGYTALYDHAASRFADYISNFPGIFFTQRPDMTFSYLSKGIRKLFPRNIEFSRDSGLFLSKIIEQDREHYLNEINSQNLNQTYSFTYRIVLPTSNQIIYLLDLRTPSITKRKLLSYDLERQLDKQLPNTGFLIVWGKDRHSYKWAGPYQ